MPVTATCPTPTVLDAEQTTRMHQLYRHLHQHPELSMQEHRTADFIGAEFEALGVENFRCGGTGVVGILRNGEGPTVAFRADTDGLPISEDTGFEYASTAVGALQDGTEVPVMHGCGHDTHITAALTAASQLLAHPDSWAGTLVLVFQPGEETAAGARAMVADGLWEKAPRPEAVLGQHVMPVQAGTVTLSHGNAMALADALKVTLFGKQSHGSQPQSSTDPIVLGAHLITRLQSIVSREIDPRSPAVITVGTFHAGLKENIIPDRAEFTLNVRTFEPSVRAQALAAIRRMITAEAAASGAPEPCVEELYTFPRCYNEPVASQRIEAALRAELGETNVVISEPLMGSEDVGHLSDSIGVPGVYWMFGGFDLSAGEAPVNHSPLFGPLMEPTLTTGTRAAVAGILAYLGNNA